MSRYILCVVILIFFEFKHTHYSKRIIALKCTRANDWLIVAEKQDRDSFSQNRVDNQASLN